MPYTTIEDLPTDVVILMQGPGSFIRYGIVVRNCDKRHFYCLTPIEQNGGTPTRFEGRRSGVLMRKTINYIPTGIRPTVQWRD